MFVSADVRIADGFSRKSEHVTRARDNMWNSPSALTKNSSTRYNPTTYPFAFPSFESTPPPLFPHFHLLPPLNRADLYPPP